MSLIGCVGRRAWMSRLAAALVVVAASAANGQPAKKPNPKVWAVVIGVEDYEDAALHDAPGAVSDAREVRRWLVNTLGWDGEHVLLMTDGAPREHGPPELIISSLAPTKDNLDWALTRWLPHRVQPGDIAVIYFAGQAAPMPSTPEASKASPGLLLPIDARAERLDQSGWVIEESLNALASGAQIPILLWLDTSMAGRGQPAIEGKAVNGEPIRWLESLARWPGVSAWIAATDHPAAIGKPGQRSPLTSALLQGMGTAETPRNLLACLHTMNRDPTLNAQGFRALGGLPPGLILWKSRLEALEQPDPSLLLQQGHADRVSSVLYTSDGRLITAGMDSTIKVWRVSDRTLLRTLSAHTIGVTALALNVDATLLASGDGSGRIWLWRLDNLQARTFDGPPPHTSGVRAIAFLPDGQRFVSIDREGGTVLLWDASKPELTPRMLLAKGATAMAVGPELMVLAEHDQDDASSIRLVDLEGTLRKTLPGPGSLVVQGRLAIDGPIVAAGDDTGHLVVWNTAEDRELFREDLKTPIRFVRLGSGRLAIGARKELRLWSIEHPETAIALSVPAPAEDASFSDDGRWMTAMTTRGDGIVWRLDTPDGPREALRIDAAAEHRATTLAFAPRGEFIALGEQLGGIRGWSLPDGEARFAIAPHRGKIDAMAVSPDGRYLLQITHDFKARLWDLQDGRDLNIVPGEWTSGSFLRDGRTLAMTDRKGDVVLVDRRTGRSWPTVFERPKAEGSDQPTMLAFGRIAVAPDGHRIAAATPGGELASVWSIDGGAPIWTTRAHTVGLSSIAFAADSRHLLTAGLDAVARVWDLDDAAFRDRPKWTYRADDPDHPAEGGEIAVAAIDPRHPWRVVTGQRQGRVLLWDVGPDGKLGATQIARFTGEVKAAVFTPDGRWLAVAGADKTLRVWSLAGPGPLGAPRRFLPQHDEQVNTLVAWPDSGLIASGSDDTTVRFWGLAEPPPGQKPLLGTLSASDDGTWVAFTPDGQFDSSPGGETRVTWLVGDRVLPLEQFYGPMRHFGLADQLRHGERPSERSLAFDAPQLAITPLPLATDRLDAEIEVTLGDPRLTNLRLYRDGRPVRDESDFEPTSPDRRHTRVRLHPGVNTFYAMAGRGENATDGRSNVVEIRCNAPVVPGQTHILALGVSNYKVNALQFADDDAEQLAGFLNDSHARIAAEPGLTRILKNDEVNDENVREALLAIRDQARPDDTVVVFLAGHADVRRDNRFCLLLPEFPFPEAGNLLGNRGVVADAPVRDEPGTILPYANIYRVLARIDAGKRLVIIDACQAGAIFDDPHVRRIQERCDDAAHQVRTAYFLAARKGESAAEPAILKHGLLTHVLLRGLGAPDLVKEPGEPLGNADQDGNHLVTTEELRQFASANLPGLANRLAGQLRQARPDGNGKVQAPRDPAVQIETRLEGSAPEPFPLARIPDQRKP